MSAPLPPELAQLAAAYGVATRFHDWLGNPVEVSEATVRAVLAALDVPADTPAAAEKALAARRDESWRRRLPPCVVTTEGEAAEVHLHVPSGASPSLELELECDPVGADAGRPGRRIELTARAAQETRRVDGRELARRAAPLPADLPLGYHRLRVEVVETGQDAAPVEPAVTLVIVTPARVPPPAARSWGLMAQLYQVRSRRSWGLGDLADLADLAAWSGKACGAGYLLVNPLHAAEPIAPMSESPYLPTTRRFVNPVYLRVEAVPEYAYLPAADREGIEAVAADLQALNASDAPLDRDRVWAAKRAALERVHRVPRSVGRDVAYAAYRDHQGAGLVDFATWCALAEQPEQAGLPWQDWPEQLQDPGGAAVVAARSALAERVDFYCWLQWVLDEQLANAQRVATDASAGAGMPLGIVHDLAVGVHPSGADAWALGDALARGVTVGAPPDEFNQQGQDWSQPPWRPDRLAELGYAPYRDMLRTLLRHAGGIRIDHVMGLFRLWWVPAGLGAAAGTYVRYDGEAMLGILALEAHRAGAVVIGEDLGTVEPGVREQLRDRGVLGTSILWFERDAHGQPLPPDRWRELCLATVTTHDLPPTAGYLRAEHLRVREELGLLTQDAAQERARAAQEAAAWRQLIRELGLLDAGGGDSDDVADVVLALHALLARTPALLLGVMLPDLVGDERAINQPGTHREYPNWRLPLADAQRRPVLLEDIVTAPFAERLSRLFAAELEPVACSIGGDTAGELTGKPGVGTGTVSP